MENSESKSHGKALVIGASMAGLLAARALADHFDEVTLVERDHFPAPGENRKGVPQGRHTHVLLERGHQIIETYLPGLTTELRGLGAVHIDDVSANVRWFHSGAYHQPGRGGFSGLAVSRPTLEAVVRQRVLDLSNVCAIEGASVTELLTTDDKTRVTGLHLRAVTGSAEDTCMADLIVDASGRGSRSPAWLESLGYQRPQEEEVAIDMGYVSCYFRRRPEDLPGIDGIVLMATPPDRRLGVLLAQDGGRWVLTVGGYLGDHAASDYEGFMEAVSRLPTPEIYQVVKDAEVLGEPVAQRFPANLRRRYDRLPAFPAAYLVIGDALCSFNPIYGQGMTVAALEALALDRSLTQHPEDPASSFFAEVSKVIDLAWSAAVGSDLSFPDVQGPRTPMVRFLNWYLSKLHRAAHSDSAVSIAFLKVINMIAPPPSLLHPRILFRVLKARGLEQKSHGLRPI